MYQWAQTCNSSPADLFTAGDLAARRDITGEVWGTATKAAEKRGGLKIRAWKDGATRNFYGKWAG